MFENQFEMTPVELLGAYLARAQGRNDYAARKARAAVARLDDLLKKAPDDYRALLARAQAQAILGDAPGARESVARALVTTTVIRDVLVRSEARRQELLVLAMIADSETLAHAMQAYLQLEMTHWDFDGLILNPVFDPHRDHPSIRALAAHHSRRETNR